MNTIKKARFSAFALVLSMLAVSCLPTDQSIGDAGTTFIKFAPSDFNLIPVDAKPSLQTAVLLDVRKLVANSADLSTSTVVELTQDAGILTKYNALHDESFVELPTTLATTVPAVTAGKITLTFNSQEHAKSIMINIPDATKFDFTKKYAMGFRISKITGAGVLTKSASDTIVCQVLVKNKYDGVYEVTAVSPMVDVLNATLTGWYPFTYHLETSGENSCTCLLVDPGYYNYYHPITSGVDLSVYGSFGLEVFFDPATGKIANVKNVWGNPPSNTRMPAIDPSGVNKYDPVTKTILFKYWMRQPSLVPDAPNIRVYFDEKWTYKGAR